MLGPQHLLPQDLVDVIDHGPPDDPFARPVRHRWHATDAKHALTVEPDRYKLVEYDVSAEPHQPGYSAVTREMLVAGFDAPLRERAPREADVEPEPDAAVEFKPEPEPEPEPAPVEPKPETELE